MANGVAELPDDPTLLKQIIAQRDAAIEQIKREAAEQMEAQRQKHQAEMQAILRRFYGPHNERFDPAQLLLFGQLIDRAPLDVPAIEQEAAQKLSTRRARHNHGRQNIPDSFDRIRIEHDLPADQKPCPCCGKPRRCIGTEVQNLVRFRIAEIRQQLEALGRHEIKKNKAE